MMAVMSKLNNKTLNFPPQLCRSLCSWVSALLREKHGVVQRLKHYELAGSINSLKRRNPNPHTMPPLCNVKKQTVATEFFGCPSLSGGCIFWPRRHHRQQGKHGKAGSREVNGMGTSKRNTMGMGPKFNGPRAFGHSSS